jgi:hypothetical protein
MLPYQGISCVLLVVLGSCSLVSRQLSQSLSLGYSRALTQQLSIHYHARARGFIDFPSSGDIILVHFIPIILSD